MKPFDKTKLLKPVDSNFELTEPDYSYDSISFYIPTYFNPDLYFENINIATSDNEDYINLYLNYNLGKDGIELCIIYNNLCDEVYDDFSIDVELDEANENYLRKLLFENQEFIKGLWIGLEDIPMNPETEELESDYAVFKIGTVKNDIWGWFNKHFKKGINYLINIV